jgi:hypothetical protein
MFLSVALNFRRPIYSPFYSVAKIFQHPLGWHQGLDAKFKSARAFYSIVICSTVVGVALDFAKISPVKALFYTAVINGLLAPLLLVGVLLVANRSENHAQTAKLTLERRLSVHHVSVDVRGCNWNVLVLKAQRRTEISRGLSVPQRPCSTTHSVSLHHLILLATKLL